MKHTPLLVFALAMTVIAGVIGLFEWQRHQRQDQQLLAYEQHVQQLLGEVENSSLRRLDAEKQLQQVRDSLAEVRSQMNAVSNQLQVAQERINPEFAAMEQRIRREVRSELQAQRPVQATSSRNDLLRQLSQLDPDEMGELMTLQTVYGGFLQSLNVDDARLEVIVDGLSNMIAEQNQARMELVQQMQQDNTNPRQLRNRMQSISNPATQVEALSFILTDEEMAVFQQFQANQPQQAITRTLIQTTNGGGRGDAAAVFLGTPPPGTAPGIINYEIITAEPNN